MNADACSAYGAPTTLVGTPAQSGFATGCYRYVLTGTDNVGNTASITTVVKVDTTAPAAPGLVLSDSSADVHTTGTTAFYRPAGSGSFDVTASSTDGQSGILDYSFPALAGFTGSGAGATRTYTLATPTEPNGAKPVTARNQALLSSTATNFTLTSDSVGPTGGALTVNTVAATRRRHPELRRRRRLHHRHRAPTTAPTRPPASQPRADTRARHAQRRRLLGLRRPDHPRRHPGPERPRHRLLPLRPHRHRQRRQHLDRHHRRQGRHLRTRQRLASCSPTPAPTCTPPAPPPSTAPPAPAPSTSPPRRPTRQSGILDYSFPALAGFTGSGAGATRTYTLAHPDRAERRQARHRPQPGAAQLDRHQLHPHLRLDRPHRRRADGQRHGRAPAAARRATTTTAASRSACAPTTTPTQAPASPPRPSPARTARSTPTSARPTAPPPRSSAPPPRAARHRLLPLHAHRHRQRRQRDDDHDGRQGRSHGSDRPVAVARRHERRRPHHRHDRLLPARRQRLLRRHRQLHRRPVRHRLLLLPGPRRLHRSPAPAARAPTPSRPRPSPTAPRRSPRTTTPVAPTAPPSPSPPTRRLRPAAP